MANNTLWFTIEVPAPEIDLDIVSSTITIEIDVPAPTIELIISQAPILLFDIEAPAPQISLSIKSGELLSLALHVPAPTIELVIAHQNQISLGIEAPAPRIALSILTGEVLTWAITAPVPTVILTIGHQNELDFNIEVPAPSISLLIHSLSALIPIRKGFAMNLSHYGVTEYSNFPFNSFANYHNTGIYIGTSEDGIFILDGDDDNGVKIEAVIQGGTEDLFVQIVKRLREGWAVKRGGPLSVQLILDDGRLDSVTRDLTSVRDVSQGERVKFPRGLKNQFVSFVIRNLGGADFDLESFRVFCDTIERRKR